MAQTKAKMDLDEWMAQTKAKMDLDEWMAQTKAKMDLDEWMLGGETPVMKLNQIHTFACAVCLPKPTRTFLLKHVTPGISVAKNAIPFPCPVCEKPSKEFYAITYQGWKDMRRWCR